MSYRHTLEAAVESLHEIEELIKNFPDDRKIPVIEIDLALQKLRNLYELLLFMKNIEDPLNTGNVNLIQPIDENQSKPVMEKQETSSVVVVEESKTTTVAVTTKEEKAQSEEAKEKTVKQTERVVEKHEKNASRKEVEVKTIADKFKGGPTLAETLSKKYTRENGTLGDIKPVTDLMSAIAINDRFTFIRELFRNDRKAFESAIGVLNNANSYDDAYNYLMQEYGWDMDGEAVQLLLNILRRKYIKRQNE